MSFLSFVCAFYLPLPFRLKPSGQLLIDAFVYAVFKVRTRNLIRSGDEGIRTLDPLLARQVLSQLSYTPIVLAATYPPAPSPVQYHRPAGP